VQERGAGGETRVGYSTSVGYPTIEVWALGGLGCSRAPITVGLFGDRA
jgi:hypothetical protein